ncbi:hypothetical protein DFQ27_004685 [Actinomortierella ambigua]|uniref:Galactose oxidase n=1 Tax=Actinomortierella ambigua TaxID=1343610 RepID=A0A9P6U322_9FUNG|nr:hypothetical protein DFQ27_004685 [Actinomortierella ambigua]
MLFFLALEGITAQVAPLPVALSAFAKHKNKLYIYGGSIEVGDGAYGNDSSASGQFFALDLSKPWTSKSPSWIQLPTGPRSPYRRGAISLDGNMFAAFPYENRQPNLFSFETKVWSPSKAIMPGTSDSAPVTLGTDGTVLIPGEFSANSTLDVYSIYSFDSDNALNILFPPPSAVFNSTQFLMSSNAGQGGVWSQYLKSAVYYGGYSREVLPAIRRNLVFTYHPESKRWEEKATNGLNMPIAHYCMAITDDGKRVVLHGGVFDNGAAAIYNTDIFILDLDTFQWKKSGISNLNRGWPACTVAGDYFLLWGGADKESVIDAGKTSTPVNIYQISTGTWVSEYAPSAEYLDPVPAQPSDAKPNIGIIAGGTVGGIAAVALIGFLVWMRKKRGSRHRPHHDDLPSDTDHSSHQKESKVEMHVTSRVIQTPSRVAALHPPQYPYGSDDVDDGTADNRHSTKDAKLYSTRRATRSPPPGPQSHPFGTNIYNSYAADGSQYSETTIAPPHSALSAATTYGYELPHYSPPSSSRSGPGSRNPQTLGHSYMTREKWTEERPGPQWQP